LQDSRTAAVLAAQPPAHRGTGVQRCRRCIQEREAITNARSDPYTTTIRPQPAAGAISSNGVAVT
jgi:hypothetical protein